MGQYRRAKSRRGQHINLTLQVGLMIGFWLVGEFLVRLTNLPIPGGVAGMFVVLALLLSGRLDVAVVKRGAELLLAEMLLFFIPAVLIVLNHQEFFGWIGLKILAIILCGTFTVMAVTALTIDIWCHWAEKAKKQSYVLD
jgi:holin-like protein